MITYAKRSLMKRVFCFFFLLFSCTTTILAQNVRSSLLWEISGNGLAHPSYLFGTFHIMCKGDFSVSGVLENKLKSTGQFYGEIDLDDPNLQTKMMMKMMMQGKTLQSLMTESDYQDMSTKFQSITGMSMAMLNNFKPFVPLSLLTIKTVNCVEQVQPETELVKMAKENHLSIHGLETADDQIEVIDKEPLDSQIKELKQIVSGFDSVKNVMSRLLAVYKLRNIDTLYSFMKSTGASEDFETELLDKRNKKWIPVIQKAIAEKPTFFAVGAGHLGGPEGVIGLLRKQGYKLTPLMF